MSSSYINMRSILNKVTKYTTTPKFKKKVNKKVDDMIFSGNIMPASAGSRHITIFAPSLAAEKFIEVLQSEIIRCAGESAEDGELGASAIAALIQLDHDEPIKVGTNRYQIGVSFTEDLSRDSLYPGKYDGIENIAALLNAGYSAFDRVYGKWDGHGNDRIASLQHRSGAHFIENAIRNYMLSYAKTYGVIDIEIDDVYK